MLECLFQLKVYTSLNIVKMKYIKYNTSGGLRLFYIYVTKGFGFKLFFQQMNISIKNEDFVDYFWCGWGRLTTK